MTMSRADGRSWECVECGVYTLFVMSQFSKAWDLRYTKKGNPILLKITNTS